MKEHLTTPLFQPGILRMPASKPGMANTTESLMDVAERTRKMNTPHYLKNIFKPNKDTIFDVKDADGGIVSVVVPSGKYRPDSVMIIATEQSRLETTDEVVTAHMLYDLPKKTQENYWRAVFTILDTNPKALYMENASIGFSDNTHRLPRTIAAPHAQIGSMEGIAIEPVSHDMNPVNTEDFQLEQKLFQTETARQALQQIHRRLREKFPRESGIQWQMYGRQGYDRLPAGYAIGIKEIPDANKFAEFMNHHYDIFAQISQQVSNEAEATELPIKPQPSHCLYVDLTSSGVRVVIAPIAVTHHGTNERGLLYLDRSTKHTTNQMAPEEYEALTARYRGKLHHSFNTH